VSLKQRLAQVPGFDMYTEQLEQEVMDDEDAGPVEALWRLLRTGHPLLVIYNALNPETPLQVDDMKASEEKRSKIAILKFVQACLNVLKISPEECFIINDLTGDDTTGFVKVAS
jgi:cell division control protein 24